MPADQLALLKSLKLFDSIPDKHLESLVRFLKPRQLADKAVVFEEGSRGESLFFVSSGRVRISKKVGGGSKELALLSAGDCFGEMALLEPVPRSATAAADGDTSLFELGRDDLNAWLKERPEAALDVFSGLLQVQSGRLRRTSSELALIFDLSNLLLEPVREPKQLFLKVLDRVLPHLDGTWSAATYLYNQFNDEMDFVASHGTFDFTALSAQLPPPTETKTFWVDPWTYYASLPGDKRPHGYLIFRSEAKLSDEDRSDLGRTLTTVARLLVQALENVNFRVEEMLRARLKNA